MHKLYEEDVAYIANLDIPWEKMDGKSVLIVGASGLIGTCLVEALIYRNKNHNSKTQIYAMGRSREKAEQRFGDYLAKGDMYFIEHDITSPIMLERGFDYYIHGASNTHPVAYASDPVGTITTNIFGMYHILEHAATHNAKRVLLLSTVEVYGDRTNPEPFTEDEMGYINCNTARAGYPESKRVAESLCQSYRAKHGMDVVIGRLCRSYGPTMSGDDSKALAQFIRNGVNGQDIVLKSEGMQNYSYCYMADAVSGLLTVLLKGETGEAYNIADPASDVRLKDIASVIAAQNNRSVVFELPDDSERKGYSVVANGMLDAQKIRRLGFSAKYSIEEGISRTICILRDEK